MNLKVETADCPNNIGIFSSAPFSLNYSIREDKKYDVKELYSSKTQLNFKDIEWHLRELEEWKVKTTLDLNNYGVSRSVPDIPNSSNIVVAAGGNPPCMNYVNRNWKATNTDCVIDIFYVDRIDRVTDEYFLVDQIQVNYASLVKAKAETEAKNKAQAEAQAKIDAEKQAAEAKAKAVAEAKAKNYVTCSKGKQIKKIPGAGSKCPKGFKKIS
jgi:hypothetical protein